MVGESSKGKISPAQASELASATHKPEDNKILILLVGAFYPEVAQLAHTPSAFPCPPSLLNRCGACR